MLFYKIHFFSGKKTRNITFHNLILEKNKSLNNYLFLQLDVGGKKEEQLTFFINLILKKQITEQLTFSST